MKTFYSEIQMSSLRAFVKKNKLSAPISFFDADLSQLQKICTGAGADSLPRRLRKVLTRILNFAEASVAIHDYDYYFSDGYPEAQKHADDKFLINALSEVVIRYSAWWQLPARWRAEWAILRAYRKIRKEGVNAWCVCFRNNTLKLN